MSRRQYLLTLVLALSAGFAGHALYGALSAPQPAEARSAGDADELQWEFCAVTKAQYAGSNRGGVYWIVYFRGDSVRTEDVQTGPTGNAFAKAVTRLGEDGWDMVGEGPLEIRPGAPGGTPTAIFFKRRKE